MMKILNSNFLLMNSHHLQFHIQFLVILLQQS